MLKIEENNDVVGKYLQEIAANKDDFWNYRIVAIKRDFSTIIPRGVDICKPNDIVYINSNKKGITPMLEVFGKKKLAINKVMILGGSRTGRATA